MIKYFILLQLHFWLFSPPEELSSELYQEDDSYIVQLVGFEMQSSEFPRFSGLSNIISHNSKYYFINEHRLLQAFLDDTLNLEELDVIIEANSFVYAKNKEGEYQRLSVNYSIGINGILYLDDTGIYKIGEQYFVIRRLKYAYLEDLDLKFFDNWEDNLRAYDIENLRLFLFMKELLPISHEIEKYVWKRKFELTDFWQGNIMKQ